MSAVSTRSRTSLKDTRESGPVLPARKTSPLSTLSNQVEKVMHQGDDSLGKIFHLRQTHWGPSTGESKLRVERVGASQEALLRYLITNKFEVVAEEEGTKTLLPNSPERNEYLRVEEVSKLFPKGVIPSRLSSTQVRFLAEHGAILTYAALNPAVTLLPTTTLEESRRIDAVIDNPKEPQEKRDQYLYDEREKVAIKELTRYLIENPGTRIAVAYGGLHTFDEKDLTSCDQPTTKPSVIQVSFPKVRQDFPELTDKDDSYDQLNLIRAARGIDKIDFYRIKTAEGQIAAIPKIGGFEYDSISAEDLRKSLKLDAVDERVKNAIDKAYNAKTGPFRNFVPRSDVAWNWSEASSKDPINFSLHIANEKDQMTQLELLKRVQGVFEFDFSSILTSQGQLLALQKLIRPFDIKNSEQLAGLRDHLLDFARSEEVKEKINALYRDKKGPFVPIK